MSSCYWTPWIVIVTGVEAISFTQGLADQFAAKARGGGVSNTEVFQLRASLQNLMAAISDESNAIDTVRKQQRQTCEKQETLLQKLKSASDDKTVQSSMSGLFSAIQEECKYGVFDFASKESELHMRLSKSISGALDGVRQLDSIIPGSGLTAGSFLVFLQVGSDSMKSVIRAATTSTDEGMRTWCSTQLSAQKSRINDLRKQEESAKSDLEKHSKSGDRSFAGTAKLESLQSSLKKSFDPTSLLQQSSWRRVAVEIREKRAPTAITILQATRSIAHKLFVDAKSQTDQSDSGKERAKILQEVEGHLESAQREFAEQQNLTTEIESKLAVSTNSAFRASDDAIGEALQKLKHSSDENDIESDVLESALHSASEAVQEAEQFLDTLTANCQVSSEVYM